MATISTPLSTLKPYSIIRVYGKYYIPVYELDLLKSKSDLSMFTKNDVRLLGTSGQTSAPSYLIGGTFKECYTKAIDNLNLVTSNTPSSQTLVSIDTTYSYPELEGKYSEIIGYLRTSSPPTSYSTVSYSTKTSTPWNFFYTMAGKGYNVNGNIGGSTAATFLFTFIEDNIRYYVRLPLQLYIGRTDGSNILGLMSNTSNVSPDNVALTPFYGFSRGIAVTIDAIGFGTAVELSWNSPVDPFTPGGNSGENDTPPGTFDSTSDTIPDSPLPTLSMADTGFTRIYNPSLSQVQNLAEYMWKTENIFETLWNKVKQSFENPMDVMIAFNIVPVAVPDGGTADFSIMYIPTGVQLTKAANQFVDVDCGTLTLQGYYGSALDYSPNTRIQCFLPFIGMIELNPDEVMNTTLQIKYRVDIVSGGCVAKIFIDNNCLYQYSGHCSISVPFSASDFSSYMNAMLQVSALAVGAIAAGTGAALAEGSVMGAHAVGQATNKTVKHVTQTTTERNPATGRQITTGTVTTHTETERANETTEASFNGLSPQNITNTASAVMASKVGISHAGSFNGNTGYLGVRYPFLIITTPRQCLPASFQTMNGYPSMITLSLGDCTGYTRVQQVQLTGMTATNPEQAEILQLLKEGVIL